MRKQFFVYTTQWFLFYQIYTNYCQQRKIKHFHEYSFILYVSLIYFFAKPEYILYIFGTKERNNVTL